MLIDSLKIAALLRATVLKALTKLCKHYFLWTTSCVRCNPKFQCVACPLCLANEIHFMNDNVIQQSYDPSTQAHTSVSWRIIQCIWGPDRQHQVVSEHLPIKPIASLVFALAAELLCIAQHWACQQNALHTLPAISIASIAWESDWHLHQLAQPESSSCSPYAVHCSLQYQIAQHNNCWRKQFPTAPLVQRTSHRLTVASAVKHVLFAQVACCRWAQHSACWSIRQHSMSN